VSVGDEITVRREVAGRMAQAALLWLDQLDPDQRRIAVGAVRR
jgi:hypothetical protein